VLHVFEVLGGDGGNGDVVDVDFLLSDEVQQQVQRSLVMLQANVQRRHNSKVSMWLVAWASGSADEAKKSSY